MNFQRSTYKRRLNPSQTFLYGEYKMGDIEFQATYDDRFEWGLIHSSSGKFGKSSTLHQIQSQNKQKVIEVNDKDDFHQQSSIIKIKFIIAENSYMVSI